ncbi:YqgE/AlgH family protein [Chitinophaga sp. sic0106]|uniref:YqgE/AlgH family protein n=1 Tax=Chitinophaga sp. sic0106 TaxID=2854785 RepID=UPI001C46F92B|nr:YqgE/AlgH family protein [Chitinophaga sp. sic0106]MBV7533120.1 YqgE/AlgH family protein [Chitinophaga sp. sic0106]
MKAGDYLHSTALLDGSFFEGAMIFLAEYNENGAMGFVTNKLFPHHINELEEFKYSIPFPIHDGGPMDREHLFFVHQRPDLIPGGTHISGNHYLGGDFKIAMEYINTLKIDDTEITIFLGYCGWDAGDLEAELAEGSWLVGEI